MAGLCNIEKLFDFDDTDDSGSSVSETNQVMTKQRILHILTHTMT